MPTLYITGRRTHVSIDSKHLEIREFQAEERSLGPPRRVPLLDVERVVVVGCPVLSVQTLHRLALSQIPIFLLRSCGRVAGVIAPERDGDAYLRIEQYRRTEDAPWLLANARRIVGAKLLNARRVVQKLAGDKRSAEERHEIDATIARLRRIAAESARVVSVDELRGLEGAGAAAYYAGLRDFFPEQTPFLERNRRPPRDPANALLSLTYTMVTNELRAAVKAAGLDVCLGTLHAPEYGRPSLALDLVEAFRAPLCDLFVLRLLNLKVLQPDDFEKDEETGGVVLRRGARKKYFIQYEQRMMRPFKLQGGGVHTCFRDLLREAVTDYVAALRGERPLEPFAMP